MDPSELNMKERIKLFEQKVPKADPQRVGKPKTERQTSRPTKADPQRVGKPKTERQTSRPTKNESELFEAPAQLIYTDEQTMKLRCNENTLALLHEINHPLNVVGITGLYRTGKSYLLNRLAGGKTGFNIGSKVRACTKGIWIWCRHHPLDEDQVLVLLDVEGFGDTEKVNRKEDTWLFTLATLLSSSLVYNNKGTLDSYALDRLNFLEEIESTIQVSQNEEDKRLLDFDFFFPYFVVTLRDFGLEIVNKSDEAITPDEYLEGLLVQCRGEGKDVEAYNRIRLLIRRYFKNRKCFVFIQPCGPKAQLEKLSDKDLEPDFLNSVEEFCKYIFSREPLQLKSGRNINGRMFANLGLHYVNAISENKQPSILEATRYMVDVENQTSVATASDRYKKEMQNIIANLGNSNPSDEALVKFHEQCMTKALDFFKQVVVFDDEDIFKQKAMSACRNLLSQFKHICDDHSTKSCIDAIARLNQRIERKLKNGAYCCESGYDEYVMDINWIANTYNKTNGLGAKAKVILQNYLDGKAEEEAFIHELVLKAKGEGDIQLKQEAYQQRPSNLSSLAASVSRSDSFVESLKKKVDNMEKEINHDLEERFKDEKKHIQESYIKNIEMKLNELEMQRSEAQMNGASLSNIEEQIAFYQKVLENPSLKVGEPDVTGLGTVGRSQEHVYENVFIDTVGGSQEHAYENVYIETSKQRKSSCKLKELERQRSEAQLKSASLNNIEEHISLDNT